MTHPHYRVVSCLFQTGAAPAAAPAPAAAAQAKEEKKPAAAAPAAAAAAAPAAAPAKVEEKAADAGPAVAVSAAAVKELRDMSGAGMMDCKKALAANNNDVQAASEYLRKKGLASADKKAGRTAAEGMVTSYIHAGSRLGVLVEVNCETDFVARGDRFKELAADIAMQIAACPSVEYVSMDDVDPAAVAKEREIEMGKEDLASKPEAIRSKIVEGRVQKIFAEKCLVNQDYIKNTDITVEQLLKSAISEVGENMTIRRFERFNLGEGIEKKSMSFADEVAEASKI